MVDAARAAGASGRTAWKRLARFEACAELLNACAALILPFAVSWYGVFMLRQYLLRIPDVLLDAARSDGASELRIFFAIVLPLARPALVTRGLFVFIYRWNEFL